MANYPLSGPKRAMYMDVFGGEPYASWAVEQVKHLRDVGDFWVIVHDGCLDNVKFGTVDVRKIKDPTPSNVATHMQLGAKKAAEFGAGLVFLVSCDDWFHPDVIKAMFTKGGTHDIVFTNYEARDMNGAILWPSGGQRPNAPMWRNGDPEFPKDWPYETYPVYLSEKGNLHSITFPECAVYRTQMFLDFPLNSHVNRDFVGEWLRRMKKAKRFPTSTAVPGGYWYNMHVQQLSQWASVELTRGFEE